MSTTNTFARTACYTDFFETDNTSENNHCKNHSYNDKNNVTKNQEHFGNRKRIKP